MKSILDPGFKYVSSNDTDIRKTFARIRREQAAAAKRSERPQGKVIILTPKEKEKQ